jgi:hypothetical protein
MLTFSIRNVGQLKSTYVSVYYLAKYKYFAFIFHLKRQTLYLAKNVNIHRPFGLAQTPYVFYTLLATGFIPQANVFLKIHILNQNVSLALYVHRSKLYAR